MPVKCVLFLALLLLPSAARGEPLRFSFAAPSDWAAVSSGGVHTLVGPSGKQTRRVLGQRLHYSISTAYGDDGVFVGGNDAAELHFCADGRVYGAQREELVATGYERSASGARRGVWAESSFLGRDALVVEWDGGGVETLALSPQDSRSTIARTLELVGPAERRKVEEALKNSLPSTIVMFRVEDGRPMMFDHEDSTVCE